MFLRGDHYVAASFWFTVCIKCAGKVVEGGRKSCDSKAIVKYQYFIDSVIPRACRSK
jgi:hypothetical protein